MHAHAVGAAACTPRYKQGDVPATEQTTATSTRPPLNHSRMHSMLSTL